MADLSGRVAVIIHGQGVVADGLARGLADAGAKCRRAEPSSPAHRDPPDLLIDGAAGEDGPWRIRVIAPAGDGGAPVELLLWPAESAHYTGRCIAALAMDPDIADKHGGIYHVAALAREYRFSHPGEVSG